MASCRIPDGQTELNSNPALPPGGTATTTPTANAGPPSAADKAQSLMANLGALYAVGAPPTTSGMGGTSAAGPMAAGSMSGAGPMATGVPTMGGGGAWGSPAEGGPVAGFGGEQGAAAGPPGGWASVAGESSSGSGMQAQVGGCAGVAHRLGGLT